MIFIILKNKKTAVLGMGQPPSVFEKMLRDCCRHQKFIHKCFRIHYSAVIFVSQINNMKKILLLVLVTFSFGSLGFAQDFSFDELV